MAFFGKTVASIVNDIKNGSLKSREIVEKAFSLIDEKDGDIKSFISLNKENALMQADRIDSMSTSERENKPLLGIPIAVKDNICTKDILTTCASNILGNFRPPYNATVVDALKDAGAIIVGKTNLDEFAMGSSTENSAKCVTRNPKNRDYIPGGSSGGSAAAVSAGFVPLSLGSDTGGSIRQPAAHCGVLGLKPTYGRVSRYGLVAFASSLDQIGPFAEDARDLGLLLSVISRPDGMDSTCAGNPFEDRESIYSTDLSGMKIGVPKEYFGEGLVPLIKDKLDDLRKQLEEFGAEFVDISLPNMRYAVAAYYIACTAEASSNLSRYDGVKYGTRVELPKNLTDMYERTRYEGFGNEVKRRIMLGTYVLSSGYYDAYYLKGAKVRTIISKDFDSAFEKCDAIFSPVTPTPPFKIGEKVDDPLKMYLTDIYTVSANLAGIPGVSVPCGTSSEGLPIGAQFMAPKWREDTILKLSYASQSGLGTLL